MSDSKNQYFDVDAFIRMHTNAKELLQLDGILVNIEIPDDERTVQAQHWIENVVKKNQAR